MCRGIYTTSKPDLCSPMFYLPTFMTFAKRSRQQCSWMIMKLGQVTVGRVLDTCSFHRQSKPQISVIMGLWLRGVCVCVWPLWSLQREIWQFIYRGTSCNWQTLSKYVGWVTEVPDTYKKLLGLLQIVLKVTILPFNWIQQIHIASTHAINCAMFSEGFKDTYYLSQKMFTASAGW